MSIVAFVLTAFVVCATPGPAVCAVVFAALRDGRRAALGVVCGVLAANGVYAGAASLGIGVLLASVPTVYGGVRLLGAAYLGYRAWQMWFAHPGFTDAGGAQARRSVRLGFGTQLASVGAVAFFAGLLPGYTHAGAPIGAQMVLLGALFMACDGIVLAVYATFAGRARKFIASPRAQRAVHRIGAGTMLAVAVGIVVTRT